MKAWDAVTRDMDKDETRRYWSEQDLSHGIVSELEAVLHASRQVAFRPHVDVTLEKDYFSGELAERIDRFIRQYKEGRKRAKVRVDLVIHRFKQGYQVNDTKGWDIERQFELCAELKYFKHGKFADYYIDKTENDLQRLVLMRRLGVCHESVMMVAADPDNISARVLSDLSQLLDKWQSKLTILRREC